MLAEFIQLPEEGDRVGPYLVRKLLGGSILGNFYRAVNEASGKEVLLHIIPEALGRADPRFHERYREAIAKQEALETESVLKVEETHCISGNFLVEYRGNDGFRSLNTVLVERETPLPAEAIRQMLRTLGKSLDACRKLPQGHYFLTPDFLFLEPGGDLRIAGVGLFESIDYEAFERFVSGAVLPIQVDQRKNFSALEILSPEIRNFKTRDRRSDFYCLGMCAYFMLTGEKPERKWILPSQLHEGLDEGWDLFVSHCLEPRPADRFQHYGGFLGDLEEIEKLKVRAVREKGRGRSTLDRIPLPKRFERAFGERSRRLLRMGFLGLAGGLAVITGWLFLQIIESETGGPADGAPISRITDAEGANLILEVRPFPAMVRIGGTQRGSFVLQEETLYLDGKPGSYHITVSAPGRKSERLGIELSADEAQWRRVELMPEFVPVRILGLPGTTVHVAAESGLMLYLGEIGLSGEFRPTRRLLAAEYVFLGDHAEYRPVQSDGVVLGKEEVVIRFEQTLRPAELRITSKPAGARVYLGEAFVGQTPVDLEGLDASGPINLRIEKEGFRTVREAVRPRAGARLVFDAGALEPETGRVAVRLENPEGDPLAADGFTFRVDGEAVLAGSANRLQLRAGRRLIEAEHPDYFPLEVTIDLSDEADEVFVLRPEPRPARVIPRLPEGLQARFVLDERPLDPDESGALEVPPGQPVRLEAVIQNFHTVIQRFDLRPNEELDWEIPLRPLPGPLKGEAYEAPYFGVELAWIDPGSFVMGSPLNELRRLPNEDRPTRVRLDYGYWIGTHEIRQETYERLMQENPSQFQGEGLPVESVSWDAAVRFCARLTAFEESAGRLPEGYVYRLPTEAEWAFAARAGTQTAFSFGPSADSSKGNFHGSYAMDEDFMPRTGERYGTLPAGSFPPNPFGLYDVHGNVAEWTLDRYWDRLPGGTVTNPYNRERGRGVALRGGSWRESAERVRSAAREGVLVTTRRNSIGFRIVLGPEPASLAKESE